MRDIIANNEGWHGHGLDDPASWAKLIRSKALTDFLVEDDHIAAVRRFFLISLDAIGQFKTQYPHLPWERRPKEQAYQNSTTSDA
jgi:hypothetical protein